MTTHAEIGFALTAIFGVAVASASSGLKPVVPAKPVPIERPFAVAWSAVEPDVAKKADKVIRVIPITVPEKTVTTERILVPPVAPPDAPVIVPSVAVSLDPDKPVVQRRRHVVRRDVCARHGMKKVYRGKRWNCRK